MSAIQARFVDSHAAEVRSQNVFSRNRLCSGYNCHREVTIGPVFHKKKKKRRKNRIYIIYEKHRKSKNNVEQQTERRKNKKHKGKLVAVEAVSAKGRVKR